MRTLGLVALVLIDVALSPLSSLLEFELLVELLEPESSEIPTVCRICCVRLCLAAFLTLLALDTLSLLTIAMCELPAWNLLRSRRRGSLPGTEGVLLRGIWRRGILSVGRGELRPGSRFCKWTYHLDRGAHTGCDLLSVTSTELGCKTTNLFH